MRTMNNSVLDQSTLFIYSRMEEEEVINVENIGAVENHRTPSFSLLSINQSATIANEMANGIIIPDTPVTTIDLPILPPKYS